MTMKRRTLAVTLGLAAAGLAGCTTSVSMNNQSDTWLDVRYYVATPSENSPHTLQFVAVGRQQIEPGSSGSYDLTMNPSYNPDGESIVHVFVEPTAASWEQSRQYWIELLTPAPVTISVTGPANDLQFSVEDAGIAPIPEEMIADGRFYYTMVQPPKDEAPADAANDAHKTGTEVVNAGNAGS